MARNGSNHFAARAGLQSDIKKKNRNCRESNKMKSIRNVLAASLVLIFGLSETARADPVAIVIDDSQGMCPYLSKTSATEYERLLSALISIAAVGEPLSVFFLSDLKNNRGNGSAALQELERIKAGRVKSSSDSRNRDCIFRALDSKMEKIFSSDVNHAGLTLLITDFIFDGGGGQGGAGNRYEFVQKFGEHFSVIPPIRYSIPRPVSSAFAPPSMENTIFRKRIGRVCP
ncbi:MAG: hypothetical protein ACRERU_22585 [Methylococcales bacterium]